MPAPYYFDYCSFVVLFEMQNYDAFSCIVLSQNCSTLVSSHCTISPRCAHCSGGWGQGSSCAGTCRGTAGGGVGIATCECNGTCQGQKTGPDPGPQAAARLLAIDLLY